ncbi:hypothetical protein [Bdellovibrio bacteriovorus]|uniref:hypothetical protein n=1 Tax=Bdellovibrio bacteriovorus TaxID=959 RepID=UPI0035A573A5
MKKILCFAIFAVALICSYNFSFEPQKRIEGEASFASLARTYAPLKLPPFPKTGLNQFNSSAEVANFQESYHERQTFSWNPGYPIYIPAFDSKNTPFFRKHERSQTTALNNGFVKLENGVWKERGLDVAALQKSFPASSVEDLIRFNKQDILWDPKMAVFDKDDVMYTVLRIKTGKSPDKNYVLMYSKDKGTTWESRILLSSPSLPEWYDLERPYSPRPLQGPPAFLYFQATGKAPGYEAGFEYWQGTVGRLTLQTTAFDENGELVLSAPIELSKTAQPIGYRSGSAVKVLRAGRKYFVVWLEADLLHKVEKNQRGRPTNTVPNKKGDPNSAIWIAEYDTQTKLLKKQNILKTWPTNDSHNQPGLVRTSQGRLVVVGGAHGAHFASTTSLQPDSIEGWTPAQYVNTYENGYPAVFNIPGVPGGGQTYVSLVIDSKDQLHLAYRLWMHDKSIFDFEYFGALAYQKGQLDSSGKDFHWNKPQVLVYPNAQEYTHYYQVMTIDRRDHLYLEYSQMRPYAPYYFKNPSEEMINTSPMANSALLKSSDFGDRWYLVNDDDF